MVKSVLQHNSPQRSTRPKTQVKIDSHDEKLARSIAEESPNMIFINQGGRVVYANKKCEEIMGYTQEEYYAPGFDVTSLLAPESVTLFMNNIAKHLKGKEVTPCEYILVTRTGARIDTIITTKLIQYAGRPAILGIITDISEKKWIENERNRYMEHLSFLSRSAMHFVRHEPDENIFLFIAGHLRPLIGNALIAVNDYDPEKNLMTIRATSGDAGYLQRVNGIIGENLLHFSFTPNKFSYSILDAGRLMKVEGGLPPLANGIFPNETLRDLEKMFSPYQLYLMPFMVEGDILGSIMLIVLGSAPLGNSDLIEAFVNQAAVALKQRQSLEALRKREQEFKALSENSPDIIIRINRDLLIVYANPAVRKAIRVPRKIFLGRTLRGLGVPDDVVSRWEAEIGKVFSDGRERPVEFSIESPKGLRYYYTRIVPEFSKTGEVDSILAIAQDITQRKLAEERLENLLKEKSEELVGTQKQLEDARRLSDIGVLAATIAHEIRNPLAAIKTAAYNLRRKSQNESLEHHINNIDKKVDESDQIIKNLLSYSRIKLPNYEWVAAAGILEECMISAADKYSKWDAEIIPDFRCRKDDVIEADPVHLKALFTNILDNAYQALPDKKGTIRISAKISEGHFHVTFADNGTGIDRNDLRRITEPFFTRKSRGTGLGLTVCSQIVNLHNGTIFFESEKGRGTTVTISLPLRKDPLL